MALKADAPLKIGSVPHRLTFSDFKPSLNKETNNKDNGSDLLNCLPREPSQTSETFGLSGSNGLDPSIGNEQELSQSTKAPLFMMYKELREFLMQLLTIIHL